MTSTKIQYKAIQHDFGFVFLKRIAVRIYWFIVYYNLVTPNYNVHQKYEAIVLIQGIKTLPFPITYITHSDM